MNEEQKLFNEMAKLAASKSLPPRTVWGASINLLINAIIQAAPDRKTALAIIDQLTANAKMILDVQYDPATGKRRQVHPFTQIIEPPYVQSESVIFSPRL